MRPMCVIVFIDERDCSGRGVCQPSRRVSSMSNRTTGGSEGEKGEGTPLRRASIRVVRRPSEGKSELPAALGGDEPMVVITEIEVQEHIREKPVPQRSTMWLAVLLVLSLLAFLSAGMMFVLY